MSNEQPTANLHTEDAFEEEEEVDLDRELMASHEVFAEMS